MAGPPANRAPRLFNDIGGCSGRPKKHTFLDGSGLPQPNGTAPAPPYICGSRPPSRNRTCNMMVCAAMPRAPASMSFRTTATSPCQVAGRVAPGSAL